MNTMLRKVVLCIGSLGTLIFGTIFITALLDPAWAEHSVKEIIRIQLQKTVKEKIEAIDTNFLGKWSAQLTKNQAQEIADAKVKLAQELPEKIAAEIAQMSQLNCECRRKIEKHIHSGFEWKILNAAQAQERLTVLIRSKYMETAEHLVREFQIFSGANALVFALLLTAIFVKKNATLHLLPPAIVLIGAATITGYLYLFNQNWLHTILFSDYVGFAYFSYLGIAFMFLCDIVFNRGRITIQLINAILTTLGQTLSALPC